MPHEMPDPEAMLSQDFWDERYSSAPALWSGRPNRYLVEQVSDLTPGTALDVGAGEGADAIWLADRGWQVSALDISVLALDRAAGHAAATAPASAARITWQQADVRMWAPGDQRFDLVSAQYLHLPQPLRDEVYGRLGDAVSVGGTLLIVAHHPSDLHTSMGRPAAPGFFFTAEELAADLDPEQWKVMTAAAPAREATDPDGHPVTIRDAVLKARRIS